MNEFTVPLLVIGSVILGAAATLRSAISWGGARRRHAPARPHAIRAARGAVFTAAALMFGPAVAFVTRLIASDSPDSAEMSGTVAAVFATALFASAVLLIRGTIVRAHTRGAE